MGTKEGKDSGKIEEKMSVIKRGAWVGGSTHQDLAINCETLVLREECLHRKSLSSGSNHTSCGPAVKSSTPCYIDERGRTGTDAQK